MPPRRSCDRLARRLPCVLGRYTRSRSWSRRRSGALGLADARRDRRSPRLHASVRLRARRRARATGVDVRLLTSRFRFGAVPEAEGFTVDDSLYRVSTRRWAVAAAARGEGARASPGARPARPAPTATCSTCSGSQRPEADGLLLHTRRPLVFTAHDLLPRRTASQHEDWKRLFGRFDRIVTHSERGREDARGVRRRPRPSSGSSPTPPSAAIPPGTTTAARCSRSA